MHMVTAKSLAILFVAASAATNLYAENAFGSADTNGARRVI